MRKLLPVLVVPSGNKINRSNKVAKDLIAYNESVVVSVELVLVVDVENQENLSDVTRSTFPRCPLYRAYLLLSLSSTTDASSWMCIQARYSQEEGRDGCHLRSQGTPRAFLSRHKT